MQARLRASDGDRAVQGALASHRIPHPGAENQSGIPEHSFPLSESGCDELAGAAMGLRGLFRRQFDPVIRKLPESARVAYRPFLRREKKCR